MRARAHKAAAVAAMLVCSAPAAAAPTTGVSPQVVSLPTGPGSIEGLGLSFEPQVNTGTATFAVELRLPPGRAGHAPALSLSYDGGTGNGVLGLGWKLAGVSWIGRQSDKGLPRYDGSDVFVTWLGEELVPLSDGTFRAENEGGFSRYRFDEASNRWTCELRNGVVLTLGATADARVESGGRTYRWYVTRAEDPNGNRVEFSYAGFSDSPGVVYLDRVFYTRHAAASFTGEHVVAFGYEPRPDPFSDFRPGFEMQMARRLRSIDACTRGGSFTPRSTCDDAGEPGAARVRSHRFVYDEVGACDAGLQCVRGIVGATCSQDRDCMTAASRLARIETLGADALEAFPPTRLEYTDLRVFEEASWHGVPGFPVFTYGGPELALVDLQGDGLPDVVESLAPGSYRRFDNQGPDAAGQVAFAEPAGFPGPQQQLSTAGTQLADLDGDGLVDLLTRSLPGSAGFLLHRGTGRGFFDLAAQPFQIAGYDTFSAEGFESPEVRLVDLDFDKRIDVLRTVASPPGSEALRLRLNRTNRLDPEVACDALPLADFANGRTFLVDMNGDRLLDVVVVETRVDRVERIRYYPGAGSGAFGRGGSCDVRGEALELAGDPVSNVPTSSFLDFRGFQWGDVTHDGLADLLFTGPAGMTLWINRGGDELRRVELGGYPAGITLESCVGAPGCDRLSSDLVELADLNGNGSQDLLLVDRDSSTAWYLDVVGAGGVPPNLLRVAQSGLGLRNEIGYVSSTRQLLDAAAAGQPWRTRPPFPVTLMASRAVETGLDLDEQPGADRYVTEFRYRDGYYDGYEREFRGFSEAVLIERGDASQPTLVTRNSFHTGAPDGVDNDGDGEVDERSPAGGAEEESLKGLTLEVRLETCPDGPDGDCLETGESFRHDWRRWEVRRLHGHRSCSDAREVGCCSDGDCTAIGAGTCEAPPGAPPGLLPEWSCASGRDVHYAVSTGQRTAILERGDPADRADVLTETDRDSSGNVTFEREWGLVDAPDLPPFGCLLASGLCSNDPGRICGGDSDCGGGSCVKSSSADAASCAGDPFAFSNPALPRDERVTRSEYARSSSRWMLNRQSLSETADGEGTIVGRTRSFFDGLPFGEVDRGNPSRSEDWLGAESRWIPTTRNQHDAYGNLVESMDARGGRRSFAYDAAFASFPASETIHLDGYTLQLGARHHEGFGLPVSASKWGVDASGPETRFGYDAVGRLESVVRPGDSPEAPTAVYSYHPNPNGDGISWVVSRTRETAGGGTIDALRYSDGLGRLLGTKEEAGDDGWVFVDAIGANARGATVRSWNPYFTDSSAYEAPDPGRAFARTQLDATGRILRVAHPDGSATEQSYEPLVAHFYDENDVAGLTPGAFASQHRDGLERPIAFVERDGVTSFRTDYEYDVRGLLARIVDAQDNEKTIEYDSLGRRIAVNDPDRGRVEYRYDDTANLVEIEDAGGRRTVFAYDAANRTLSENDLDLTGDPATDPVDVRYEYDLPSTDIALADGSLHTATFTAGLLASAHDRSGEEHFSYDERQRILWRAKRIRDAATGELVSYASEWAYDSSDRVTRLTYPDGDRLVYRYDPRGLLAEMQGASGGTVLVSATDYTASGQIARRAYGNGVETLSDYDDRLRVTDLRTVAPGGTEILDDHLERDPASNVLEIVDLREAVPFGDPRHDSFALEYDGRHQLIEYRLTDGVEPSSDFGRIAYGYDGIGNRTTKSSTILHEEGGLSVTDLGALHYGGPAGSSGRSGRLPGDPPGPHALTGADNGDDLRTYEYDDSGNVTRSGDWTLAWDFHDRLTHADDGRVRVDYVYDHRARRVLRSSVPSGGGAPTSQTHYVGRHFELRDGVAFKYASDGSRRLARFSAPVAGDGEVTRWLRLVPGWNLVAVPLEADDAATQLGIGGDAVDAAYRWVRASREFEPVAPADSIPAGTVLWLRAVRSLLLPLRGTAADPAAVPFAAGGDFAGLLGPETVDPASLVPEGTSAAWTFDARARRWRSTAAADAPFLVEAGVSLVPGGALFARSSRPGELSIDPGLGIRFYHADAVGSTAAVTDAVGALVEETSYYPFGHPRRREVRTPQAALPEPYLFGQSERDADSGFYDFGARGLDAVAGVFLSVDPALATPDQLAGDELEDLLAAPRDLNLYAYARGNPFRFVDPLGLKPEDPKVITVEQERRIREAQKEAKLLSLVPYIGTGLELERQYELLFNLAVEGAISGREYQEITSKLVGDAVQAAVQGAVTDAILGGITSTKTAGKLSDFFALRQEGLRLFKLLGFGTDAAFGRREHEIGGKKLRLEYEKKKIRWAQSVDRQFKDALDLAIESRRQAGIDSPAACAAERTCRNTTLENYERLRKEINDSFRSSD